MSEVMEADKNCQGRVFPIASWGGRTRQMQTSRRDRLATTVA
jgi:hypothetical protein